MSVAQSRGSPPVPAGARVLGVRAGTGGRLFLGVITQEGARIKARVCPGYGTILHCVFALFTCHKPGEA